MTVAVLTYGGILQSVEVPDREGESANVTLGFAELAGYLDPAYTSAPPFFGALIGRYANRIAGGRFELDGVAYQLAINDGPNHLHGGGDPGGGFDVRLWDAEPVAGGVRLSLVSPAGEGGYPGELRVAVTYSLAADANVLSIAYEAVTDAPTIVNLTSHGVLEPGGGGLGDDLRASAPGARVALHAGRRHRDPASGPAAPTSPARASTTGAPARSPPESTTTSSSTPPASPQC